MFKIFSVWHNDLGSNHQEMITDDGNDVVTVGSHAERNM